jgi:transcriptional repressor NrdR
MPQVVKQDGTRSEFDLEKLRTGFMRALHKRPVPTQLVDDAVATITQDVLALGEREVPSRRLGEMVMRELKRLDQVAYIRFASVYRSFQGVDDFQDAIKEVQRPTAPRPTSRPSTAKDVKDAADTKEEPQP